MAKLPAVTAKQVIRTLKKPLLKSIIEKDAGVTIEEFIEIL